MAGQHSEQELDDMHSKREVFRQGAKTAAMASSQVALERKRYRRRLAPVAAAAVAFSAEVTAFLEQHYGCTTDVFAPAPKAEPLGASGVGDGGSNAGGDDDDDDDDGDDDVQTGGGAGGGSGGGGDGGEPTATAKATRKKQGTAERTTTLSLVERWAEACPSSFPLPRQCSTVREMMASLCLDDEVFLKRIQPVGDWKQMLGLLNRTRKKVNIENKPKLKSGDRVVIREGNSTHLRYVGVAAVLNDFFSDNGKWGLKTLPDGNGRGGGEMVMIAAGNLERVRDEPTIRSLP
jgi:hypothetical protein